MIIDGKKIAEEMLAEVVEEVKKLPKPPRLAAVLAGDTHLAVGPPSGLGVQPQKPQEVEPQKSGLRKFLELKKKAAEKVGIDFRIYEFPAEITTQKLRKEIVGIAKAKVNQGIIIELPLPAHINTQYILNAIPPEKDPDVLSEKSQGSFFVGRSVILPPAVEATKQILKYLKVEAQGKTCAVFGYGLLVGKPVSHWLAQQGATISMINEFTLNAKHYSLDADIIISGVSKPNLITADTIKDGVGIIDFGYNVLSEAGSQKLGAMPVGDVDFDEVSKKAGWITPVPGGVGPIVVAAVLKNLITLYKIIAK